MLVYFVLAADYAEIKNDFVISRESLPAMFIATPNDKKASVWTKEAPSVQVCIFSSLFNFHSAFCRFKGDTLSRPQKASK